MILLVQTLHDWSMFSTSWAILATRNTNDGDELVRQLKWRRQGQVQTNSWIISSPQWTMKCHNVAECTKWKMSWYKQSHPMSLGNACVPWLTVVTSLLMKKRNVMCSIALSKSSATRTLQKKLLVLDLKVTTAKMLKVCWTHITISDNLDVMGLSGSKPVHAIHQGNLKK